MCRVPLRRQGRFRAPLAPRDVAPTDPDGPTVLINEDFPILFEAIKHHQEQYPDVYGDEVAKIVRETYGEVAVCKIAHSQKLAAHIPEEDLTNISERSRAHRGPYGPPG